MEQIIEIASDNRHLKKDRGFLVVSEEGREIGRVPLDQILAVMVHAHGITYSNNLLVALAEQGSLLVLCAANHSPKAVLWPLENHSSQGARMRAQWQAGLPLQKQLWKRIVSRKIEAQADALAAFGAPDAPLRALKDKVRSGDPGNVEAQAARRYWPLMMGEDFRRDTGGDGGNALLNYGYTIIRSLVMRAVVAAGLNATIGLHHTNRGNAFALADDLMEPFRPLVDCAVRTLRQNGHDQVTSEAKQILASLVTLDMPGTETVSPLNQAAGTLALSLVRSFETGKAALAYPRYPTEMELISLGEGS